MFFLLQNIKNERKEKKKRDSHSTSFYKYKPLRDLLIKHEQFAQSDQNAHCFLPLYMSCQIQLGHTPKWFLSIITPVEIV